MFNKEKFGNIINLIVTKGYNDNKAEFARAINLDRTYISKWINKRLSSAPIPKILEKIAYGSKGITTYEELMRICGYIENTRTAMEDQAIKSLEDMIERQAQGYSLIDIVLKYIKRIEGRS